MKRLNPLEQRKACGRLRKIFWLVVLSSVLSTILAAQQPAELFVIGGHPNKVFVLDSALDQVVAEIPTHGRIPREIEPAPDGKTLYVGTEGREKIEVIDLSQRKVVDEIDLSSPGRRVRSFGMAITPKGDRLYAHVRVARNLPDELLAEPAQIWTIDLPARRINKLIEVPWGVFALVVSADGGLLYAFGPDIYVIDPHQGRILQTTHLATNRTPGQGPVGISGSIQYEQSGIFSTTYTRLDPITKKEFLGLFNFDVATGEFDLMDMGPPVNLNSAVVSPDRKRAYAVWDQLFVIDLVERKVITVKDLEITAGVANITRDGSKLYVSGQGPYIYVYDTKTLNLTKTLQLSGETGSSVFRAVRAGPR